MQFHALMAAVATAAFSMLAVPANAHPQLVSSTPADASEVANVRTLRLIFSEKLIPQLSGFELVMTAMPGMAHHDAMPIKGFTTGVAKDGKTLEASLPRALPAGTYDLSWHAVAADTHPVKGKITFKSR